MIGVRRSSRIPKEIPIVLLGTDTSGRVFSEETRTLVLSRHGAGILSRNKFSPDEILTMRRADTGIETDIRLVGHLGEDPRGNVYGIAFSDPNLNFWQIEFPPPPEQHLLPPSISLECCFCSERALVQPTEIETDVYLASETVLRFCSSCGQTTPWKHATGDAPKSPARRNVAPPTPPRELELPSSAPPASAYSSSFIHTEAERVFAQPAAASSSAYSPTAVLNEIVSSGFIPATLPAVAPPPAPSSTEPPAFSGGGKKNRRRHVRTRVHFTACIRLDAANEELVECDNISKGGFCFRSRKHYGENTAIQVAVAFSPGQAAIFVGARIKRVEELPGANLFRYGAAYA